LSELNRGGFTCRGIFISSAAPLGHATGVHDGVQTVWLPVARSQKARFASRKRIKAFACHHRTDFNHWGEVSKALLIYIPVTCSATCSIDARSFAATPINDKMASILSLRVSWIKRNSFIPINLQEARNGDP